MKVGGERATLHGASLQRWWGRTCNGAKLLNLGWFIELFVSDARNK